MTHFKILSLLVLLFIFPHTYGQKVNIGFEISPTIDFKVLKNKQTKNWSSTTGYGFNLGFLLNKKVGEYSKITTGLKLEYFGFNKFTDKVLITSNRTFSFNVPLYLTQEIGKTENWFYSVGLGLNYNFSNRSYFSGTWTNVNSQINQLLPYLSLGLNYTPAHNMEVGLNGRYLFRDIWDESIPIYAITSTHLALIEVTMKYFLPQK